MLPLCAAEYRKMVEKLYNSPQYGLEKRIIDLYEVKLCGSGEDSKAGSKVTLGSVLPT